MKMKWPIKGQEIKIFLNFFFTGHGIDKFVILLLALGPRQV